MVGNAIADVNDLEELPDPNIMVGSTPEYDYRYLLEYLFDDLLEEIWEDPPHGIYYASTRYPVVMYDFGSSVSIGGFRMTQLNFGDGSESWVTTSTLEFSNDSDFSTVIITENLTHSDAHSVTDDFEFDPVSARYVRWTVTDVGGNPEKNGGASEQAFFGSSVSGIVRFSSAASGAHESLSPANLKVVRTDADAGTAKVDYAATNGTAEGGGVDYTLEAGTLIFGPNEVAKTITIEITNDDVNEANETIVVTLSNPNGLELGILTEHTYTIFDARPMVAFDTNSSSAAEDVNAAMIPVSLSYASGEIITVEYNVSGGTATGDGVDYNLPIGTLTFDPCQLTKNITIDVVDDVINEANPAESVVLALLNPTNATLGSRSHHTYVITDDEPGAPFDGFLWYHSDHPEHLVVNEFGQLGWQAPWPPDQITVQLPEMGLSEVGDAAEVVYLYKGEGPTEGASWEDNLCIPFGTGDFRIGLLDSNGQPHVSADRAGYADPMFCGYLGYQVRVAPHVPTDQYSGRFSKRVNPNGDGCDSLLSSWDAWWPQELCPRINGFGLGVGVFSPLILRLERTAPGTIVFTATLNNVTYTLTDNDVNYQPTKIDAVGIYFANDRPFDLVTLDFVRCSDLDDSGVADFRDLGKFLTGNWLWSGQPGGNNPADFSGDGVVDFRDYTLFAFQWQDSCH
jgi:hypothetical protein